MRSKKSGQEVSGYRCHSYFRRRWDAVGRRLAFAAESTSQWRRWHLNTTRTLREITGYETFERAPLNSRVTETRRFEEYTRQRVEIQTEPGVVMPMYVLIPARRSPPYPSVIAPHGHVSGGKLAVAGCRENPEVAETISTYNYDYGIQFVQAGFIVFCPDARGMGERQETAVKGRVLAASCQLLNNMAYPLGQTVTGMWTWDLHRLLDYIESRPDCDPRRIGCAGLSGGGLQTLWAAALDPRIRCAVISGYLYGYKEALLDANTNCSCNYVPHLYEYVDMGDIAALIAPRPLLVETGNRDPLNGASGLKNVHAQMRIVRRAYRLTGAPARLAHDVFDGGHRWNGVKALAWMQRHLEAAGGSR